LTLTRISASAAPANLGYISVLIIIIIIIIIMQLWWTLCRWCCRLVQQVRR